MDSEYIPTHDDEMASSAVAAAAAVAVTEQEFDSVDPALATAAEMYADMFPTLPTPTAPRGKLSGGVWDKVRCCKICLL